MNMGTDNKDIEINRKMIAMLDKLLAAGKWDESLFLRNISKKFRELRQEAEQLLIERTGFGTIATHVVPKEKPGHVKVFISLYQTEGNNLQKWHRTLRLLTDHSVSRPVYQNEEEVKAMIRAKADVLREGYVSLFVKEQDIMQLPPNKVATDKLGHELMTLKAHAVKPENILEFIHNQKRYHVEEQGLVLKD